MNPTPEQQIHVGIDVSKRTLEVCLLPQGESFTLANDQEGVEELLSRLQKVAPKLVVLEATGGYEQVALSAFDLLPTVVASLLPTYAGRLA